MLVSTCCLAHSLTSLSLSLSSGVDLTLSGISITDNGRISSVDEGQNLACTSTQGGTGIGSWTLPDGTTVQDGDGVVVSDGSIALTGPLSSGVYRCNIADGNGDDCVRTIYIFPDTGMCTVHLNTWSYCSLSLSFYLSFSLQSQIQYQRLVQDQMTLH